METLTARELRAIKTQLGDDENQFTLANIDEEGVDITNSDGDQFTITRNDYSKIEITQGEDSDTFDSITEAIEWLLVNC